jgi:hypothetical protein
MLRSQFTTVDRNREHNIVWIEDDCDSNGTAKMSVTNDAENVVTYFRSLYGNRVRIVYRDTEMEWWEIVAIRDYADSHHPLQVLFKPWYGLEWDILSRVEN